VINEKLAGKIGKAKYFFAVKNGDVSVWY